MTLKVLGIHPGHTATAALLLDDRIVACASEERFNRKKGSEGFPESSIEYVLSTGGIEGHDLDAVVIPSEMGYWRSSVDELGKTLGQPERNWIWNAYLKLASRSKRLDLMMTGIATSALPSIKGRTKSTKEFLENKLGISRNKIIFANHHLMHAYSAIFASTFSQEDLLVFTNDGAGDFLCATVGEYRSGSLNILSKTDYTNSLGLLWLYSTNYLGMKPLEHEYKVMGLAPYAPEDGAKKAVSRVGELIKVEDDLRFSSKFNMNFANRMMYSWFQGLRFDCIAAGLQSMTEDLLLKWIRKAIEKTGIHDIVCAGGTFMNVKANMRIAAMPEVKRVYFMPSGGDESLAIGCAYFGAHILEPGARIKPFAEAYLGPSFEEKDILIAIGDLPSNVEVSKPNDMNHEIAAMLAEKEIVARFNGRMEWGARALGNRSILARADNWDTVRIINAQIKQRDFWMPFAPSMTPPFEDYLQSPDFSKVNGQFMIVAFNSTDEGRASLAAASHPYDFTLRPQLLESNMNSDYFGIIQEYANLTGHHAVLNTSFNLHGEPIVCSPSDAVSTLLRSGLENLAIGRYILKKKKPSKI